MKNYKMLVPIVLVVMLLGSIFTLSDLKATEQRKFDEALAAARDFRTKGILVDAESYYLQAEGIKPSVELSVEIGQFYWEADLTQEAISWGAAITKEYPEEPAGYEFLMDLYNQQKDYIACYNLADTFRKRGLNSESVSAILKKIEYTYYYNCECMDVGPYSENMCAIMTNGKWGYADLVGDKVITPVYAYAGPFAEGMAPITDGEGNAYFIDYEGNKKHVVLGVTGIKQLGTMEEGLFTLYDGSKWHFYNTNHEKVFGEFDAVSAIANGIAAVKNNGQWHFVDRTGVDLTGKTYANVAMDDKQVVFRNDRLFVSDGSSWRMINSAGETVGTDTYEDVHIFFDTTYAAVKMGGKWGFIDKDGNVQITPQFEDARSFYGEFAAVVKDGLWGYINLQGEMVIAPQFENAREFNSNGCAFVFTEGDWKLLRLYKYNH